MSDLPDPPASPPPTSRFHAGRLVLGLVVVVIGVTALLQAGGISDVPWKAVLPGSLIAVGLGLVIAGRRSESGQGGLITIGIVLTVVLAAASAVDIPLEGGVGERTERPMSLSAVKSEYRLAVGQLTLDLTSVPVPVTATARPVRARVGVGQLIVELPSDQLAVVRGHAGMGQVTIFGQSDGGFGVDKFVTPIAPTGQPVVFSLDLSVGIGEVLVQHG
ncbi:MAG TPA: hypothetical protein VGR33_06905 [Actinomycetota bacterium]|nr:hypothetical protein [Actinomycetota bacterium]